MVTPIFSAIGVLVSSISLAGTPTESHLEVSGYGEILFSYYDHGADHTGEGGAEADSRLVFDTTRAVFEVEGDLSDSVQFEIEVELEHGGTGAALELEYEEFGEYENEIEAGGEVVVEQIFVKKEINDWLSLKVGRFYVAFGTLYDSHRPDQYLTSSRSRAETTLLPGVWDEMGLSLFADFGITEFTLQVVNGLDSTGFSSQHWIGSGHQGRFEQIRADSLSVVARSDTDLPNDGVLGVSVYAGDTVGARPKDDIDGSAYLVLTEAHAMVNIGNVSLNSGLIWGHLQSADVISDQNGRLSNNLDVLRSPVADEGLAMWGQIGHTFGETTPFIRVEYLDTMSAVSESIFDNPRFASTAMTGGFSHISNGRLIIKSDVSRVVFENQELRPELSVALSTNLLF